MIGQLPSRGWHYSLLIAITSVTFFLNLGGASLWDVDEGRNMTCALEMLEGVNYIVPYFNSLLRVDKPVLLYWLQMMAYHSFGISEFSGRLPSALAALATVLLCYELARSMFTRTTGLLAGVILATTPMLCGAARFANPDALLNGCTILTLTLFWQGRTRRSLGWHLALGAAAGLAVLAKGPVGLVLPAAVIFLFLLWQRQLGIYLDWRWLLTSTSFAVVGLPWYIWVGIETHGEFLKGFLWQHNVERGLSAMENHRGFPGYYLVVLLIGTTPWSVFLLAGCWFGFWSAVRTPWSRTRELWLQAAESSLPPTQWADHAPSAVATNDFVPAYRYLVCWIFIYGLFFSIAATKLPNYVLPVVAPCVILIARLLHRWQAGLVRLPAWLIHASLLGLFLAGVGLGFGLTVASGLVELSAMRGRSIPGLQSWVWMGLVPLVASLCGWWFVRRQHYDRYIFSLALAALLMIGPFAAYGSMLFNALKAPRSLVEQAHALRRGEDIRIGGWQLEYLPSLNFYVQRNVDHLHQESDLSNFLQGPLRVYLFMPLPEWERLQPSLQGLGHVVGQHHDMYHHHEIVVLTNQAPENQASPLSLAP